MATGLTTSSSASAGSSTAAAGIDAGRAAAGAESGAAHVGRPCDDVQEFPARKKHSGHEISDE